MLILFCFRYLMYSDLYAAACSELLSWTCLLIDPHICDWWSDLPIWVITEESLPCSFVFWHLFKNTSHLHSSKHWIIFPAPFPSNSSLLALTCSSLFSHLPQPFTFLSQSWSTSTEVVTTDLFSVVPCKDDDLLQKVKFILLCGSLESVN